MRRQILRPRKEILDLQRAGSREAASNPCSACIVLRGAVARLFLCSNGLLRTCPDRNRTNLIGIALYGVAAMAGPKTPRELAHRMRDHRAQHRTCDGLVREACIKPR